MDSTYNNSTVICPQQIYIEGEKTTIIPPPAKLGLKDLDDILERMEMRKEKTDYMKVSRLNSLLESSIHGKIATGDTILDLIEIMKNSPLFAHLHNLNNPNLLNIDNSAIDFG